MSKRHFRWIALALFTVLLLRGCLNIYSAKPIEAWIIDAETREPVAGAVVVAQWKLVYGLEGGYAYNWVVMQTVTDENGRFTFPGWGPRMIPTTLLWQAKMEGDDPDIKFYKFGYAGVKHTQSMADKAYRRPKSGGYGWGGAFLREWYLNGEILEYKPAKGDLKALGDELTEFNHWLAGEEGDRCAYLRLARAVRAIDNAYQVLKATPGAHQGHGLFGPYQKTVFEIAQQGGSEADKEEKELCGMNIREAIARLR
jgi:hypothetical protein